MYSSVRQEARNGRKNPDIRLITSRTILQKMEAHPHHTSKTMATVFHLNNREANKEDIKIYF